MSPHTPAALGQRKASPSLPRRALLALVATLACGAAMPLQAQPNASGWPAKPVKLVVGYAAGGATDVIARLVAVKLGDQLGQPVVVDNRAGANSNVGAEAVARAPADGYTLYVYTIANTINATLYPKLGYDPVKDFTPVAMLGRSPWVVVVSGDSPLKSFGELVALSQRDPHAVSFGTGATGYQLAAILLTKSSGLQANIVPYKGTPQALQDVIGQQVTATMSDFGTMRPLIASGRVRPLLVFDDRRIATIADVPCLKDAGLDVPVLLSWTGLFAAAGTPPEIIDWLAAATHKALQSEAYKAYVAKANSEIAFAGPAALAAFQRQEVASYRHAMKVGHVEPQ